ncbi:MAG: hypothetical protein SFX73_19315 [Kofleriaceae bacterium]|nr:hypothetical protein [Kofleriaceae bacterium]
MKTSLLLLSLATLLGALGPASADSHLLAVSGGLTRRALDFRAADPSCIDGERFADEVSAKLGFVPWDARAKEALRIRIDREGARFTGTFRNADGTAKIVDGATCAEVTSSLAVTVAAAIDPNAAPGATAAPPRAREDGRIAVTFTSLDNQRVDVALNNVGGIASANGHSVVANYFEGLCTSPCTTYLPPGRHHLRFVDPDTNAVRYDRFLIDSPTTIAVKHKSNRGLRRGLFVGGTLAAVAGTVLLIGGDGVMMKGLGGLSMAFGGAAMVSPLMIPDTFQTSRSP